MCVAGENRNVETETERLDVWASLGGWFRDFLAIWSNADDKGQVRMLLRLFDEEGDGEDLGLEGFTCLMRDMCCLHFIHTIPWLTMARCIMCSLFYRLRSSPSMVSKSSKSSFEFCEYQTIISSRYTSKEN